MLKEESNDLEQDLDERINKLIIKMLDMKGEKGKKVVEAEEAKEAIKTIGKIEEGVELFAAMYYNLEFYKKDGLNEAKFVDELFKSAGLNENTDKNSKIINEALKTAVLRKDKKVIGILIERGADPNKALETAVVGKKVNVLAKLIEKGADPNEAFKIADREGNSKLNLVVKKAQKKAQIKARYRGLSKRFKRLLSGYAGNKSKKDVDGLVKASERVLQQSKSLFKIGDFSNWNKNKSKKLHQKGGGLDKTK